MTLRSLSRCLLTVAILLGVQMASAQTRTAVTFMGDYASGTKYGVNDQVMSGTALYVSLVPNNTGHAPSGGAPYWRVVLDPSTMLPSSQKGAANGLATLGSDSLVPRAQLPIATDSLAGAMSPTDHVKLTAAVPATGTGTAVPTGPNSGTVAHHAVQYAGTDGTQSDSGIDITTLTPKNSAYSTVFTNTQANYNEQTAVNGCDPVGMRNAVQYATETAGKVICITGPASTGAYSGSTTYGSGDSATYSGLNYISLAAGNVGHQPDTSPTFWSPMTQQITGLAVYADGRTPGPPDAVAIYAQARGLVIGSQPITFNSVVQDTFLGVKATATGTIATNTITINTQSSNTILTGMRIKGVGIPTNATVTSVSLPTITISANLTASISAGDVAFVYLGNTALVSYECDIQAYNDPGSYNAGACLNIMLYGNNYLSTLCTAASPCNYPFNAINIGSAPAAGGQTFNRGINVAAGAIGTGGDLIYVQPTTLNATASANYSSPNIMRLSATGWNGTAAFTDQWSFQFRMPAGSSPGWDGWYNQMIGSFTNVPLHRFVWTSYQNMVASFIHSDSTFDDIMVPSTRTGATVTHTLPNISGYMGLGLQTEAPGGAATFVAGTNVGTPTCASGYTCTNTRGRITFTVSSTATTAGAVVATVNFSAALLAAPGGVIITSAQQGAYGFDHGTPSTTSFTITALNSIPATTVVTLDYFPQP